MFAFLKKIWPIVKNKFVLASLFFIVWLVFFDQNNLIDRVVAMRRYYNMEEQREYYINKIEADSRKLKELRTDRENLEKFAREQYYMKRDNEDIFIVVD